MPHGACGGWLLGVVVIGRLLWAPSRACHTARAGWRRPEKYAKMSKLRHLGIDRALGPVDQRLADREVSVLRGETERRPVGSLKPQFGHNTAKRAPGQHGSPSSGVNSPQHGMGNGADNAFRGRSERRRKKKKKRKKEEEKEKEERRAELMSS